MKKEIKKVSKGSIALLIALIVSSIVVLVTYRVLMNYPFFGIVMWVYMAIEAVFVLTYLIYNRGFSRKRVTRDMLPDDWSEEKKEDFIADGKRRLHASRWMIVVILAFMFTFAVDLLELFVFPTVLGWFSA